MRIPHAQSGPGSACLDEGIDFALMKISEVTKSLLTHCFDLTMKLNIPIARLSRVIRSVS